MEKRNVQIRKKEEPTKEQDSDRNPQPSSNATRQAGKPSPNDSPDKNKTRESLEETQQSSRPRDSQNSEGSESKKKKASAKFSDENETHEYFTNLKNKAKPALSALGKPRGDKEASRSSESPGTGAKDNASSEQAPTKNKGTLQADEEGALRREIPEDNVEAHQGKRSSGVSVSSNKSVSKQSPPHIDDHDEVLRRERPDDDVEPSRARHSLVRSSIASIVKSSGLENRRAFAPDEHDNDSKKSEKRKSEGEPAISFKGSTSMRQALTSNSKITAGEIPIKDMKKPATEPLKKQSMQDEPEGEKKHNAQKEEPTSSQPAKNRTSSQGESTPLKDKIKHAFDPLKLPDDLEPPKKLSAQKDEPAETKQPTKDHSPATTRGETPLKDKIKHAFEPLKLPDEPEPQKKLSAQKDEPAASKRPTKELTPTTGGETPLKDKIKHAFDPLKLQDEPEPQNKPNAQEEEPAASQKPTKEQTPTTEEPPIKDKIKHAFDPLKLPDEPEPQNKPNAQKEEPAASQKPTKEQTPTTEETPIKDKIKHAFDPLKMQPWPNEEEQGRKPSDQKKEEASPQQPTKDPTSKSGGGTPLKDKLKHAIDPLKKLSLLDGEEPEEKPSDQKEKPSSPKPTKDPRKGATDEPQANKHGPTEPGKSAKSGPSAAKEPATTDKSRESSPRRHTDDDSRIDDRPVSLSRTVGSEDLKEDWKKSVRPGSVVLVSGIKDNDGFYRVRMAQPSKIFAYNVGAKVSARFSTLIDEAVEDIAESLKKSGDEHSVFTAYTQTSNATNVKNSILSAVTQVSPKRSTRSSRNSHDASTNTDAPYYDPIMTGWKMEPHWNHNLYS